jgi:hypothetical protein
MPSWTKRLFGFLKGTSSPTPSAPDPPPDPAERLEAARQRLKAAIAPADDEAA